MVLECDSVEASLELTRVKQIEDEWTEDAKQLLDACGLSPSAVTDAYVALKDAPRIHYDATGGASPREEAVQSLVEQTNSRLGIAKAKMPLLSTLPEGLDLFIAHDLNNGQACAALVLKETARPNSDRNPRLFPGEVPRQFVGQMRSCDCLVEQRCFADAQWMHPSPHCSYSYFRMNE